MLRYITLSLIIISSLLLTACLTIEEKLSVNKDGSGTLLTTIDLSEMLNNPLVKMSLEEEMKKTGEAVPERVDSSLNIVEDMIPHNPQWTAEDLAMLEKVESRMMMDMAESTGAVTIKVPFSDFKELEKIQELMSTANEAPEEDGNEGGSPFSGSGLTGSNTLNSFVWKKGNLNRKTSINMEQLEEMGLDEESMGMMEMMFGDAKVVYIMEMPGKIKKVKGFPGATTDGNTLRQEFNFLDLVNDPDRVDEGMDGSLKYKK